MTIGLGMSMPEAGSRLGANPKSLNLNFTGGNFDRRITFSRGTSATQYGSDGFLEYAPSNQLTYSQAFDNVNWTKTNSFIQSNLLTQSQNFENAAWTKTNTNVQSNLLTYSDQFDNAAWIKTDAAIQSNLLTYSNQADNAAWTKSNSFVQTNLMLWSEDFTNAAWIVPSGTIGPVVANSTVSPDGTLTADTISATSVNATFWQTYSPTAGVVYTGSIWLKRKTGTGVVSVTADGSTFTTVDLSSGGWVRGTQSYTAAIGTKAVGIRIATSGDEVYIWGAQLVQGSVPGDYRATTSAALPCLYADYNGALRARKLCDAATTGTHGVTQTTTNPNGTYTFSVICKPGERGYVYLDMSDNTTGDAAVQINISAGTYSSNAVTGSWTNPSASVTSLGNGWYRCSLTATRNAGTQTISYIYISSSGGPTYTGDGSSGIYIADAQLTIGTEPGDVVETTSAALPVQYKAPDGTTTAEKLVTTVATNPHVQQSLIGPQTGIPFTFSYYVRAGTNTESVSQVFVNGGTPTATVSVTAVILSGPGTLDMSSAASGIARITGLSTTQWTRVAVTGTPTSTAGNLTAYVKNRLSGAVVGDSTFIWGAQLTYGLVAGDYRSTTSASLPVLYTAPDGTLTANKYTEANAASTQHYIGRAPAGLAANTVYTYSAYFKAGERSIVYLDGVRKDGTFWSFRVNIATGTQLTAINTLATQITSVGNGWYRVSATINTLSGATADSLAFSLDNGTTVYVGDQSSGAYIWGAQLVVGAVAGAYQPTTTTALPVGYPDPFGGNAAQKLCEDSATTVHRVTQSPASPSAVTSVSVYAKAGERSKFTIDVSDNLTGNVSSIFDLATGTYGAPVTSGSWTYASAAIYSVGNGWYRCSVTGIRNAGSNTAVNFLITNAGGSGTYIGDGTSGVYIYGAQLDNGYAAYPYNPTTASAYYGPRLDYDPTSHIQSNLVLYPQDFERTPSWAGSNAFIQQNLLTYSEAIGNSGWPLSGGAIPILNAGTAPDSSQTATQLTATAQYGGVSQLYSGFQVSTTYTLSVWVRLASGVLGTFALQGYDGITFQNTNVVATSVWKRVSFTFTTSASASQLLLSFQDNTASNWATYQLWGAQLVRGSTPGDYVRTVGAARATLYPNPWGKLLARKLCENTVASTQHFVTQSVTLGAGTFTLSAYFKAGERTKAMFNRNEIGGFGLLFDLGTGTITSVTGFTNPTIQSAGGGWYRVACNLTLAVGATIGFALETLDAGGLASYTGDGSSGIYIFGAQITQTDAPQNVYNPDAYQNLVYPSTDFSSSNWSKPNAYLQTNLITYSEQFNVWGVAGIQAFGSGSIANATTAPDGTLTADKITEDSATSTHNVNEQNIPITSGATYTLSVYVKAAERTWAIVQLASGFTGTPYFYINLTTGTAGTVIGAPTSTSVTSVGNGWYRCSITAVANAALGQVFLYTAPADATPTFTGTIGSGIYLWGAQLVRGTVAGDYKATTSAALPVLYQAPDGTLTGQKLCSSAATAVHAAVAALNLVPASTYTFSAYFKAGELTTVNLQRGSNSGGATFNLTTGVVSGVSAGFTAGIYPVSNNWFRCWITVTNPIPDSFAVSLYNAGNTNLGDGTSGAYIWGPNLNEGVYPHDYTPTNTAAITQCGLKGLLIEEQRANLLLQSNTFNVTWTASTNTNVTSAATTSPEGVVNAWRLYGSNGLSPGGLIQGISKAAAATQYTWSIYAKAAGYNWIQLAVFDAVADGNRYWFNLSTGVLGSTAVIGAGFTGISATIINIGNGWYRCTLTATSNAGTQFQSYAYPTNGDAVVTAGDAFTDGTFIYGAQLEAGAFATSYIPAVGSTATRNADSASITTLTPWFNAAAGTVYSQIDTVVSISPKLFSRLGPTISGGIGPYATSTNVILDKNGTGSLITASGALVATNTKTAWSYDGTNVAMSVNGGTVATVAAVLGTPADALYIGRDSSALTNFLNGHIQSLRYYPTRLPDATLKSITA